MIDKTFEISAFLKKHYEPSSIEETAEELQLSTQEVLNFLFKIFPIDCIDDYELHTILTTLNYTPQKRKTTDFVWCLKEV